MISKASSTVAYGMGIITSHLYPLLLPDLMNEGGAITKGFWFLYNFYDFHINFRKKESQAVNTIKAASSSC